MIVKSYRKEIAREKRERYEVLERGLKSQIGNRER